MSTLDPREHYHEPSVKEGYEVTDANTTGIIVFLVGLALSIAVFFFLCFVMGKVINRQLEAHDGPLNKWNASTPGVASRNLESSPAIEQQQLQQLTQKFPAPRLQSDNGDGGQDLADLHDREDLLLNYYTWVDRSQGTVRIPIDRAMQLIAQWGLQVAPQSQATEQLMSGDSTPVVEMPLTNGFARTGYEQQEHGPSELAGEQASSHANNR
ncbi:hypothetical protein [Paracidobacterium acidisoli]|uniref:Uncharacterized protein n=1 Tax=Paracidobacterium acidisoli TaxID=2303751 RepID=A0A372INK9_9BACT|nr:hypothetical protein [Paracidobacterium acidisoli]MBT9332174.1 hypothetical protein [Paracidobacterium acidisoli]